MKRWTTLWAAWLIAGFAMIIFWLWDIAGGGVPLALSRTVVVLTAALTLSVCCRLAAAETAGSCPPGRR